MWVVDYEADIASDLSAFHRVDDPMTISAVRYFSLAVRLSAYAGVMAARAEALRQERENGHGGPRAGTAAGGQAVEHVPEAVALGMLAGDGWVEIAREDDDA